MKWPMKRILSLTSLCALLLPTGAALAQSELESLVADAIASNPELEAARLRAEALSHRPDQIDQPAPTHLGVAMVGVPFENFSFSENPMTGVRIEASQPIYWPGSLSARSYAAHAQTHAALIEAPEVGINLWREAALHWNRIASLDRQRAALETARESLVAVGAQRSTSLHSADSSPRIDADVSRLGQQLLRIARERELAVTRFNALLERPVDAEVAPPTSSEVEAVEGDLEAWVDRAIERRPVFAAFLARAEGNVAERDAAAAENAPLWTIGLSYTLRFQERPLQSDLVGATLGVDVPAFSGRVDARVDELEAGQLALDAQHPDLIRRTRLAAAEHLTAMTALTAEIDALDRALIPDAAAAGESARARFASGEGNVDALLATQSRLLELALARAEMVRLHDLHRTLLRVLAVDSAVIREALE